MRRILFCEYLTANHAPASLEKRWEDGESVDDDHKEVIVIVNEAKPIPSITSDGEIIFRGGPETLPDHAGIPAPRRAKNQREEQDIIGILQFMRRIPDEAAAIAFVEESIWGDEPRCPRCGREDSVYPVKNGKATAKSHRCRKCKRYFSVRKGTVMEGTKVPLQKWLIAIHLMLSARKGISSVQLSKELEICQLTAWHLEHRIREGMRDLDDAERFFGMVQADETYIGGKERWKHSDKKLHENWRAGRVPVFGVKEDGPGGKVKAFPIPDDDATTLREAVSRTVEPSSIVCTDSHPGYNRLPELGNGHQKVNHRIGQYVNENGATTNGIESLWALLKRGYVGIYHYISPKHLHRYVYELAYRHNAGQANGFRAIAEVLRQMSKRRLTYEQLTGRPRQKREEGE